MNSEPRLRSGQLLIMAIITGVTVANIYYNQPLLNLMADTFHQPHAALGWVSMLTQAGYAAGLLVFVPLGDFLERRRLVGQLLLLCVVALVLLSAAQTLWWLELASFITGMVSVVPQVLVPLAADLADNASRGRVVGTIMSGLLVGVLLARTIAGFIGGALGWRAMFIVAAAIMLIAAIISPYVLPKYRSSRPPQPVLRILASLFPLLREEPELLRVSLTGASFFAAFSAYWTTLTFRLAAAPYHYSSTTIGLFGLAGVAGALVAPLAGRSADRRDPRMAVTGAFVLAVIVFVLMGLLSQMLGIILLTVVLLDLATNGAQISNQTRIYALLPASRSRSNTIYMVFYFIGGAIGSGIGSLAYRIGGMRDVGAAALLFLLMGLIVHRLSLNRYSRPASTNSVK